MNFKIALTSSLEKVFFETKDKKPSLSFASMMKNELFSFQAVICGEKKEFKNCIYAKVKIESPLAPYIKIYAVGHVPVLCTGYSRGENDVYLSDQPGLYPDPLYELEDGEVFKIFYGQSRALWLTCEPRGALCGTFPVRISLFNENDELLDTAEMTLRVINEELPPLAIFNTGWFHADSLAVYHRVPMMSDAHFDLIDRYMGYYAKFGHNTILTPVFTPPLDTQVGGERPTMQLVSVERKDGTYAFDFTLLRRWISLTRKHGIANLEISHLFTQWGAYHAPKIMAYENGEYKRIFGWETDATSDEYKAFLSAFLPALTAFLKKEYDPNHCFFHISDEPNEEQLDSYAAAKAIVMPYLEGFTVIDASSHYEYYEEGIVEHPIVGLNFAKKFIENNVKPLYLYYCISQFYEVSNRFITMPSYRTRILGQQLYKYDASGFLHWGFNFWFEKLSRAPIDPYTSPDAGGFFIAGDPFVVYPMKENGKMVPSLRLFVFYDAMQDLRALRLLEEKIGREKTFSLLSAIDGFTRYPKNAEHILSLREQINRLIEEN